jgi:competence protein ComEC
VVLAAFGRLAMISPVVNLAVVPVVAPAMASGLLALGAGILVVIGLPHPIGALLAFPAWLSLGAIIACVDVAAALPFASVTFEPPANLLAAGSAIGLIAALTLRGRTSGSVPARPSPSTTRSRTAPRGLIRAGTAVLVVVMIGAGVTLIRRPDGTARIVVLDVGQGDAVLVEGGRGGRILVDGGPDPDLLLRALDDRLLPWDRRLDAIVLTHPHEDHVAGLALLLARYRVARVFEAGMRGPGPGYGAWTAALGAKQLPRATLSTGDRLQVDAVRLDVLWPDPGSVPPEPPDSGTGINNVSIVFLGEVAGRRFLLTGDVEEAIDPRLLERGLPRLDLLKVAHHGSRTSSTAPLLDRVTPAIAVVSAGAGNPYGHPSRATLERLESRGARTYRTDTNGSVEIGLAGDRVTVRLGRSAEAPATTAEPARRARIARPSALPAFACAVPATVADPPARSSRLPPISWAIAGPAAANLDRRVDDRARAVGGRLPQGLAPTGAVGQSSCASRRRSRRLARPVPRLTDSGTSTTRLRAADTAPRAPRASTAAAWPPAGPRAASIARPAVRAQAGR